MSPTRRAQIACGHFAGHPLGHQTDLTDPLGARGGVYRSRPRRRQPGPLEFLLGDLEPLHEVGHPGGHFVGRHLQRRRQTRHQRAFLGQVFERVETDVGLDPTHARADRGFTENRDRTDLRRVVHVGAAAQFQRERAADLDDPDLVGIGLAEQRHRAHRLGLVELGVEGVHLEVGLDGLVGDDLDRRCAGSSGERALPVEVEPQVARPVQRAGLNGVGAQDLSQRGVHHVGPGVTLAWHRGATSGRRPR